MTDYTELIKALRHCQQSGLIDDCVNCPRYFDGCDDLRSDAADAIEELSAKYQKALDDLIDRPRAIRGGTKKMDFDNIYSYHSPKADQPERYEKIRFKAKMLANFIEENCPDSRERSLAFTKLEEAVMWANASIARNE